MILWTIQLNLCIRSFHSKVGVNRNAVNTPDFTSSVAGTTNLSAASGSRIQTFPLPQTCILSACRALCKHAVHVCELTIGLIQCVFRICGYTPIRPWWVTTATEGLNSLRERLVDFVVRERSLGFSRTLHVCSQTHEFPKSSKPFELHKLSLSFQARFTFF